MKDLLFGTARINTAIADLGVAILRMFAGASLALAHGMSKLPPQAGFMQGVERLGMPGEMAWMSGFAETFGGLALAAGLLTRPAALLVAANMSVAAFMQHRADPYLRAELAYLYLAIALAFLCLGGGRFAIDRLIKK